MNQLKYVKSFRYLGDIKFDEPSTGNVEIDLQICIAEAKLNHHKTYKFQQTLKHQSILNALLCIRLIHIPVKPGT